MAYGYGNRRILEDVSFTLRAGDYLAIVGANGAGKTTLLRGLLGLLKPRAGEITRAPKLRYGYVPQLQTVEELFPFTVLDVVLMGRYGQIGALKRPTPTDVEHALESLQETGISAALPSDCIVIYQAVKSSAHSSRGRWFATRKCWFWTNIPTISISSPNVPSWH